MSDDIYITTIVALLPLTALMLVSQVNPYHALVIRGILGAVAAMVYALFGAADVALTEALVGTMLSITLYAVAVRSSHSMRMGIIEPVVVETETTERPVVIETMESPSTLHLTDPLRSALRQVLRRQHMHLELVPFPDERALQAALAAKEIHTICFTAVPDQSSAEATANAPLLANEYYLQTRLRSLYELMQGEIQPPIAQLSYVDLDLPSQPSPVRLESPNSAEVHS